MIKDTYEAFSLIETIITMVIMAFLMLLVGYTFTTMVKTSIIMEQKIQARDELDTSLVLLNRLLKTADTEGIFIYNSSGKRYFDKSNYQVGSEANVADAYDNVLGEDTSGNEVHVVPEGTHRIICYGFFRDSDDNGYLVKSSMPLNQISSPEKCFDSTTPYYEKNAMVLNSGDVNFMSFDASHFSIQDGNSLVIIGLTAEPNKWFGSNSPTPYSSQIIIRTGKLKLK